MGISVAQGASPFNEFAISEMQVIYVLVRNS